MIKRTTIYKSCCYTALWCIVNVIHVSSCCRFSNINSVVMHTFEARWDILWFLSPKNLLLSLQSQHWKSFENRLAFDKVRGKNLDTFFRIVCIIVMLTRRPASADRTARLQFQATGQPVSRTQASNAMTSRLPRYEPMRRSVCNAGASNGGWSLCVHI